jgi:23S rRNA-/tRNA-specific pseudouridylate synthase
MCTAEHECCTNPRNAHTRLVVLERGLYMSYPATKVLMLLVTGRRHQIRVHCSTIGHTIIGDYTYSDRKDTSPSRTFLHSYRYLLNFFNNGNILFSITLFDTF